MDAESMQQPSEPDDMTSTSAPYLPAQHAVAGQESAGGTPDAARATSRNQESKQLLSRNQDKAHKKRRLRELRKRIVPAGA